VQSFAERHFERIDRAAAIAGVLALLVWARAYSGEASLLQLLKQNRPSIYSGIARLFGTVFGFALTAMSITLAFAQSPRLDILRRSRQWATLWRVFTRGIRVFVIVALLGLAGIIFDRDEQPLLLLTYTVAFFVLLAVIRLFRILWAFENLIAIMTRTGIEQQPAKPDAEINHEVYR
jgi:hypothetical protein